jgi:hypothetical protein
MSGLKRDAEKFRAAKMRTAGEAAQRVALQLLCGVDVDRIGDLPGARRLALLRRLDRTLERERLKGLVGHWSYDLNRHIALRQARDAILATADSDPEPPSPRHVMKRGDAPRPAPSLIPTSG